MSGQGAYDHLRAQERELKQAAQLLIKDGKYDQGMMNKVEMAIRAYDPCLSCATHNLDGTLPVKITIMDAKGKVVDTLVN